MATDHTRWVLGPEHELAQVRRIFGEFADGVSLRQIARSLNAEGATSRDGRRFSASKLRTLVDNEIVIGNFVWGARRKERENVTDIEAFAESMRIDGMVPAIISPQTWFAAQARCERAAKAKHEGISDDDLVLRLKNALSKFPGLRHGDFPRAGLSPASTYVRRFGSMGAAFEAAGKPRTLSQRLKGAGISTGQERRARFFADILSLLHTAGIEATPKLKTNVIGVNGGEIYVCAAKAERPYHSGHWYVPSAPARRRPGRWLLVMRLNEDGQTGKDFFLLPPWIHASFSGWIRSNDIALWRSFRATSAGTLLDQIRVQILIQAKDVVA